MAIMKRNLNLHGVVISVCLFAGFQQQAIAADKYPTVEQLPANDLLADPFQFFGSDRRVKTREDWNQRQAEMLELLHHYIYGPAFPQVNKYEVVSKTEGQLADGNLVK